MKKRTRYILLLFTLSVLSLVAVSYFRKEFAPPEQIASPQQTPTETPGWMTESPPVPAIVEYWVSPFDIREYWVSTYEEPAIFDFPYESPSADPFEYKEDDTARLKINAIYAIDKNTIFLGGFLDFAKKGDALRSVLLRSVDGGRSWKEVMQTLRVHSVTHVVFLENGEGWILVQGVSPAGEAFSPLIWHTTNYGETWQIKGNSFKYGTYQSLRFTDSNNGEMRIVCETNLCKDNGYFSIITTKDSGTTWQERLYIANPYENETFWNEKLLAAFRLLPGGYYGSYGICYAEECPGLAYGQDGSEWHAKYSQDTMNLFVSRRLSLDDEWTTYVLPACIEYRQGEMLDSCKQ